MSQERTQLLVLIVCYRAADLVIDCLRSLESEIAGIEDGRVIVCENGTGEASVNLLEGAISEHGWGDWVSLRVISPNRGFAGGNNAVLRDVLQWESVPEFVLLLNSDTIVRPGALQALLVGAREHPEAGVIGARLEWPDGEGQLSCFRWLSPISEMLSSARTGLLTKMFHQWEVRIPLSDVPMEPGWLSFACALIRREALEEVGVLDDGYYLYFDDVDYCRRAWEKGWRVLYWPAAHVVHLRGRSNPVKAMTKEGKRRPKYYYFCRNRYFAKFYGGRWGLWKTNVHWYLGRVVSLLREIVRNKEPHLCEYEWLDIWTNFRDPMNYAHVPKQQDEVSDDEAGADGNGVKDEHGAA